MFKITLNNKSFFCSNDTTIFQAAKESKVLLEHSCLNGRCRSCMVKILEGSTKSNFEYSCLTDAEIHAGYILTCTNVPTSDLKLDVEDLEGLELMPIRTLPVKIDSINRVSEDVIHLILRFPPNSDFNYIPGQYINLIKGSIKRSYSIVYTCKKLNIIELYIKNYLNGEMSTFLFNTAKVNDVLRIQGPIGTFYLRKPKYNNIVFLATGTGIAPIKSFLEQMSNNFREYENISIHLFWGGRYKKDIFWYPDYPKLNIKYFSVLSREDKSWSGERGYVQNVALEKSIDFRFCQVYACGSMAMIDSARQILIKNGLNDKDFYSDIFVSSQ
jgi:CDP-4-dehydro-6-deoxyglucose reductase